MLEAKIGCQYVCGTNARGQWLVEMGNRGAMKHQRGRGELYGSGRKERVIVGESYHDAVFFATAVPPAPARRFSGTLLP